MLPTRKRFASEAANLRLWLSEVPPHPSPLPEYREREYDPPASMRELLHKLINRQNLTRSEARTAFDDVMSGKLSDTQIAGLLVGLSAKGITADELAGAATVMAERAIPIATPAGSPVLDTCGTGGDIKGTFNISTAAAILAAACGVRVVKHGNRSASGRTGSADVLELMGVSVDLLPNRLADCLKEIGICFAFARNHHPAMRHVAQVRSQLGVPTIFNLLGPLTNPARAPYQLLGVYSKEAALLVAQTLKLSCTRAWVVHADDGLDELSTLGPTTVYEVNCGDLKEWSLDPRSLGLRVPELAELQVDSIEESAEAIKAIFAGEKGAKREIATLNAGAALVIAEKAKSLQEGIDCVNAAIDSGAARRTLASLVDFL